MPDVKQTRRRAERAARELIVARTAVIGDLAVAHAAVLAADRAIQAAKTAQAPDLSRPGGTPRQPSPRPCRPAPTRARPTAPPRGPRWPPAGPGRSCTPSATPTRSRPPQPPQPPRPPRPNRDPGAPPPRPAGAQRTVTAVTTTSRTYSRTAPPIPARGGCPPPNRSGPCATPRRPHRHRPVRHHHGAPSRAAVALEVGDRQEERHMRLAFVLPVDGSHAGGAQPRGDVAVVGSRPPGQAGAS